MFADETDDQHRIVTTVFELAGEDQSGLLADVTHLLTTNGCDVRSAAVSVSKCIQLCLKACAFRYHNLVCMAYFRVLIIHNICTWFAQREICVLAGLDF